MSALSTASQRLTTVASLILERSRVLTLGLTPSSTTDTKIGRVLRQIRDELVRLGEGEGKDEWKRWEGLVEMMREDEMGRKQVAGLERPVVVPVESTYRDEEEPPEEEQTYRDDHDRHDDSPYRDTAAPLLGVDSGIDTYEPSFDSDLEAGTDQGLMMQHRSLIDDQDARLAQLTTSIDRQNNLSLQIGHELDLHQEILEDTDQAMGYTQRNLDRATGRLRRVADGTRNHGTS